MTLQFGTAWGLDSGSDGLNWRLRGACRDPQYDSNLWTSPKVEDRGQARWVCENVCDVLADCRRWARNNMDLCDQAVYGGVYFTRDRDRIGTNQNRYGPVRPARQQPAPRRPDGSPARGDVEEVRARKPHTSLASQIEVIRVLWETGEPASEIAVMFATTEASVRNFATRNGLRRPPTRCGTRAGYMRHIRAKEKPCTPCLGADAEYRAEWQAAKRRAAA